MEVFDRAKWDKFIVLQKQKEQSPFYAGDSIVNGFNINNFLTNVAGCSCRSSFFNQRISQKTIDLPPIHKKLGGDK